MYMVIGKEVGNQRRVVVFGYQYQYQDLSSCQIPESTFYYFIREVCVLHKMTNMTCVKINGEVRVVDLRMNHQFHTLGFFFGSFEMVSEKSKNERSVRVLVSVMYSGKN